MSTRRDAATCRKVACSSQATLRHSGLMGSRLVEQLGAQNVAGATAAALAGHIRALILEGRLTVGERLPSERALALELRRSRSTMTRAYGFLEDDGYVTRLHGVSTRSRSPTTTPSGGSRRTTPRSICRSPPWTRLRVSTTPPCARSPGWRRFAARADTPCVASPNCARPLRDGSHSAASTPPPRRSSSPPER